MYVLLQGTSSLSYPHILHNNMYVLRTLYYFIHIYQLVPHGHKNANCPSPWNGGRWPMEWRTVGRGETEREDLMTILRVYSSSQTSITIILC